MFGKPKEDMRVADYVLGLMDPEEALFFERDMRRDPALAARVQDWRDRIARMEDVEPDTPHAQMRRRIEAGLRRQAGHAARVEALPDPERTSRRDLPEWLIVGITSFCAGIAIGGAAVWLVFA